MYTDCEGIILRQVKTAYGRRMIVVLSDKYGKISAGTSIPEKGKNKSSLALRPFTRGRFELYKSKDSYNINGAEALESYFSIGEDVDKFFAASNVLEMTDRMLEDEQAVKPIYDLLCEFLQVLSNRKSSYDFLVTAYEIKALVFLGLSMAQNPLIQKESSDKIKVIEYIEKNSISSMKDLTLEAGLDKSLQKTVRSYISYHLGIDKLKSEGLMV